MRTKKHQTQVSRIEDVFDELLGNIRLELQDTDPRLSRLYPFYVRCGVIQRRPPRHEYFEFFRDMGMGFLDAVLGHKPLRGGSLGFVFPERWLGVAEQQQFMHRLATHPDAAKLEQVDILTNSPLIVGDFVREMVLIIKFEDDSDYEGQGHKDERMAEMDRLLKAI